MSLSAIGTMQLTTQTVSSIPVCDMDLANRLMAWLGECPETRTTQLPKSPKSNAKKSVQVLDVPEPSPAKSNDIYANSYLSSAAKYNAETLASKEGIATTKVYNAISEAAHSVAVRQEKSVIEVFFDFEADRLENGVHRSHKEFVGAINRRAAAQFRSSGIKRPNMSKTSAPCRVQKPASRRRYPRCRNHAFCTMMHMEDAVKASDEAEQEAKISKSPAAMPDCDAPLEAE